MKIVCFTSTVSGSDPGANGQVVPEGNVFARYIIEACWHDFDVGVFPQTINQVKQVYYSLKKTECHNRAKLV